MKYNRIHIESQLSDIQQMLKETDRHPLQRLSLENRIIFLEQQLEKVEPHANRSKHFELLFTGLPTVGSGIDLGFLGESLKHFQSMYRHEFAHNYDLDGLKYLSANAGKLEVQSTARGSFGVRLVPLQNQLTLFELDDHFKTKRINNLFSAVKSGENAFLEALDQVSFNTIQSVKNFTTHLKRKQAGLKLISDHFDVRLNTKEINKLTN